MTNTYTEDTKSIVYPATRRGVQPLLEGWLDDIAQSIGASRFDDGRVDPTVMLAFHDTVELILQLPFRGRFFEEKWDDTPLTQEDLDALKKCVEFNLFLEPTNWCQLRLCQLLGMEARANECVFQEAESMGWWDEERKFLETHFPDMIKE